MTLYARLRITDSDNGPGSEDPGTVGDFDLPVPIECATTPNPSVDLIARQAPPAMASRPV